MPGRLSIAVGVTLAFVSGCLERKATISVPLSSSKSIVIRQEGDSVLASYVHEEGSTPPCLIGSLPYGVIRAEDYQVVDSDNERIYLLEGRREYLNQLPTESNASSWAELVLGKCLLFSVDVRSGQVQSAQDNQRIIPGIRETAEINADEIIQWITRFDLHSSLDTEVVNKLSLLPNLRTLVIGNQVATNEGMNSLSRLPSLSRLNVAAATVDADGLTSLTDFENLEVLFLNSEQASELTSRLDSSTLSFDVKVVTPD